MKNKCFTWNVNTKYRASYFVKVFDEDDENFYYEKCYISKEIPSKIYSYQIQNVVQIDKESFYLLVDTYNAKEIRDFEYNSMTNLIKNYADKFESLREEIYQTVEDIKRLK